MSAHCHLTRKRPLLGRDSLNKRREWGLLSRDSSDIYQREVLGYVYID